MSDSPSSLGNPSGFPLTASERRRSLQAGGAALALLVFIRITQELAEGEVLATDQMILRWFGGIRAPWLTGIAVDITALGSATLTVVFTALALIVFMMLRDWGGSLQLAAASAGSAGLTVLTKNLIERTRPNELSRLSTVTGFSMPPGHALTTAALYLTIAMVMARHMGRGRFTGSFVAVASVLIVAVGASRVYLGVHYATDAVSGIALGAAWALLLAGCRRDDQWSDAGY